MVLIDCVVLYTDIVLIVDQQPPRLWYEMGSYMKLYLINKYMKIMKITANSKTSHVQIELDSC